MPITLTQTQVPLGALFEYTSSAVYLLLLKYLSLVSTNTHDWPCWNPLGVTLGLFEGCTWGFLVRGQGGLVAKGATVRCVSLLNTNAWALTTHVITRQLIWITHICVYFDQYLCFLLFKLLKNQLQASFHFNSLSLLSQMIINEEYVFYLCNCVY